MKRIIYIIILSVLAPSLTACNIETGPNNSTASLESNDNQAQKWLDYYMSEDMSWDASHDLELSEYPGVIFRWTASSVTAIDENSETILFEGMPIWNVYLCDLTGDGLPELCATVSLGSGIIDERIIVYDYASQVSYEVSDRRTYNYVLTMNSDSLQVIKSEYGGTKSSIGNLVLVPKESGNTDTHLEIKDETEFN